MKSFSHSVFVVVLGISLSGAIAQQSEEAVELADVHEPSVKLADLYEKRPVFKTAAEAMEYLRTKSGLSMEESMDLRLSNGISLVEGKSFAEHAPLSALKYLSKDVPATTLHDRLVLMSYLKDPSIRVRCLAAMTLDRALNAYPGGMSASDMQDMASVGHRRMVELFAKKIAEQESK